MTVMAFLGTLPDNAQPPGFEQLVQMQCQVGPLEALKCTRDVPVEVFLSLVGWADSGRTLLSQK